MLLIMMMMVHLDINIVETRKDNITGMHGSRPTDRSANINVITIMITITIVTKYDDKYHPYQIMIYIAIIVLFTITITIISIVENLL